MNINKGYEVKKPYLYQKRCFFCKSIVAVPYGQMNFNGPTFARCVCGHEVQFTDDLGSVPANVSCVYDKGDLNG